MANLIQQRVAEVSSYLLELKGDGEISDEEFWDTEFTAGRKEALRRSLEAELSGDETHVSLHAFNARSPVLTWAFRAGILDPIADALAPGITLSLKARLHG